MDTYWFVYITIGLVGLVQIPIGIDLLRFAFPKWKLSRFASKTVHFFLFTVMGTIYIIGLSYHLFIFLPLLVGPGSLLSFKGLGHIFFALYVWVNVVGNYYYAVLVHPGINKEYKRPSKKPISEKRTVTEVKDDDSTANRDGFRFSQQYVSGNIGTQRLYCELSQIRSGPATRPKMGDLWEPDRTHFCKICNCAIPYLDHHCPFTGNCAGLRNYLNFFLFLFYGTIGLFYAVVITLPYFFECNLKNILWYIGVVSNREGKHVCKQLGPHSHIFIPVFAGFFLSSNMLLLQSFFLLSDLSTYNILQNWSKYPMLLFMLHRIKARKFLDKDSRVNILMRNRRNILAYLFPSSSKLV